MAKQGNNPPPGTGQTEAQLIEARKTKARAVRQRGDNPFANDVDASGRTLIEQLRELFAPAELAPDPKQSSSDDESSAQPENAQAETAQPKADARYDAEMVAKLAADRQVRLFGRVMARRGFGKASFLRLRDGSGELQLFAKKDELGEQFDALKDIDIADHVEVTGPVMVTKTGELSILAKSLRLLSKAMRPLPDKWHGLSDVEQRYRHRYVDTVANPHVAHVFRARSMIISGLRDFLDARGFLEVETPTLNTIVGGATATPFETHHNSLDMQLFLRIAPELYLKRLLVGGFERVYELGRCYRNEGISTRHNPEFTLLEFYQAYATYQTLMPMTEEMFRHVDRFVRDGFVERGLGEIYAGWEAARDFTLDQPFARVAMTEAVNRALRASALDPEQVVPQLQSIALSDAASNEGAADLVKRWATASERSKQIDWRNLRRGLAACENDGERFFAAYEYFAEPFLAQDYRTEDGTKSLPVFIIDYPFEVSPLARRRDDQPALTERFELFVDGVERCNAFSELNDPEDQAGRFRAQVEKKARGAAETMDYDADYIRALEHGMPPAAGFGLGVDRFVMMLTGQSSIRDVIPFPQLRPEGGQ